MSLITPRTSSTYSPGMTTNEGPRGTVNHQQYVDVLAEWMASMWANGANNGNRDKLLDMMSPVWYSAKYGEPDPTDDEVGGYSPRTILAFSRFASSYQPGGSPALDAVIPYVPPGPNDFVETPDQTATRIAQANFERDLDAKIAMNSADIAARAAEGAANRSFQAGENAADRALSASQTNAQIQAEMEGIKAQIKSAAMSAFNQAFSNEVSKFNVEAGMYNTQQGIQSSNQQAAGSLSSVFQQILDERTNKAIQAQLNPGDFLQREAQVRAMQGPQGTENPAYSNYDNLTKIIEMLMNTPGGVKPVAPTQEGFVIPPALQQLMNWAPQTPAAVSAPSSGYSAGGGVGAGGGQSAADAIAALLRAGAGDASQRAGVPAVGTNAPRTTTTPPPPAATTGAYSGIRNEDVAYLTPGMRALLTTGTAGPSRGADYTNFKVYDPNRNNYQYQPNDEIAPGSTVWLERFANGVRGTNSPQFISGDPQADGKPNPEVITIHNPGPKTRVDVDPVRSLAQMRGKRRFAYGTDMFDPDTLKLKSYPDEAYQNYPTLSFFQRRTPKAAYNTLSTGMAQGAYGAQLPESGRINYGDYLQVAKDPVSLAMLQASYKSGSRDLLAEVARAKARAPFGQAVQTSLIRS